MKNNIFILFLICFSGFLGYSQDLNSGVHNITPRSPEVKNLEQYGDVQVGEYSGKPNISIPIYNIKAGGVEFPVNLYYDATGIRVDQEATWVGLGWELSTIAAINYRVNGETDQYSMFYNDNHTTRSPWKYYEFLIDDLLKQSYPNPENYNDEKDPAIGRAKYVSRGDATACYRRISTMAEYDAMIELVETQIASKNRLTDYFQINCPGLSGSFYIHPGTGEIKAYGEKNKYKIVALDNHSGFEIINEDAVKYVFTTKELENSQNVNAWYLSAIWDLKTNHWMKFTYSKYGQIKPIIPFYEQIKTGYVPLESDRVQKKLAYDYSSVVLQPLFLTEIETDTEKILFNVNSSRDDLSGVGKRKLESIVIENKISAKKRYFDFEYDYFQSTDIGGDYYYKDFFVGPNHTTPDYFKKRLKLVSLSERGEFNSSVKKTHTFEYNATPLPYKTSFAKDYWGFYNGQRNDTFIPNLNAMLVMNPNLRRIFNNDKPEFECYFYSDYDLSAKAKRGANKDFMEAGILNAINYPTGGKTVFNFEPHTFRNQVILSTAEETKVGGFDESPMISDNGHSSSTPYKPFTLSKETVVRLRGNINNVYGKYNCAQMAGTTISIFGPNGSINKIYLQFNCAKMNANGIYSESIDQDIVLQPGTYVLMGHASDHITSGNSWDQPVVTAIVTYSYSNLDDIVASHSESLGSGLRINQITNYDTDGKFLNSKKYTYTRGKLMNLLEMTRTLSYDNINEMGAPLFSCVGTRYMNSIRNHSTAPNSATVGYDEVSIEQTDRDSNNNGKTDKYFKNILTYPLTMINHLGDNSLLNGMPEKIEYFNSNNDTIKKEIFKYSTFELENNFVNIVYELNRSYITEGVYSLGPNEFGCLNGIDNMYVYPYRSFKNLLTEKKTIDYLNGKHLENTISYDYNLDNYLPSKQKSLNSRKQEIATEYEYTTNYAKLGVYPYSVMVSDINWLTPTLTQKQKIDNSILSKNTLEYNGFGSVIAPKTTSKSKGSQNLEKVITYDKYDNKGNLLQYTPENGIPVSFIWGYKQTNPVAKIENTIYTNIPASLITSVQTASDSGTETAVLNALTALRNNLPNAVLTTYTYQPSVGVSTITDSKGLITYYEYDKFNRLKFIKDHQLNVLQKYCYNYKGQQINCSDSGSGSETTYRSVAKSGSFTKNCTSGATSPPIIYTVAAGAYTSTISQEYADLQAQNDVNANGQSYANANGICTFSNVTQSGSFTRNNCAGGSTVTFTVNAGTYSSTISQADADMQAQNVVTSYGQAYANATGTCNALPAPTGLTFTSATATSLNFAWTAVSGATGYKIYKDGQYISTVTTTQGSLSGLTASTNYNIQVLAYNASADGALSSSTIMTTNATVLLGFQKTSGAYPAVPAGPLNGTVFNTLTTPIYIYLVIISASAGGGGGGININGTSIGLGTSFPQAGQSFVAGSYFTLGAGGSAAVSGTCTNSQMILAYSLSPGGPLTYWWNSI